MKQFLSLIISVICNVLIISAQEMTVKSLYLDEWDKSASASPTLDYNGNQCALVIVDIDAPLMKFYGNIIGTPTRLKGKYNVYLTSGTKKLRIQHPDLIPLLVNFGDFGIEGVKEGQTYKLSIELPDIAKNYSFVADANDTSQPKHLSLMCVKDNRPFYFTQTQWDNLKDKDSYRVYGLVIIDRQEQFFIPLEDYGKFSIEYIRGFLTDLPTEAQIQAIMDDLDNVQTALEAFGGQRLDTKTNFGYYMVEKVNHELYLLTTEFKQKFARQHNMVYGESNVRPASTDIDVIKESPFRLQVSPNKYHDMISQAIQDKDYTKAIKICMKIPEDPYAQYKLGIMYQYGQGVEQNLEEAFKWYMKGAEQGNSDCQSSVGSLYYLGSGVEQNYEEALKWFEKAAKNNDIIAITGIGFLYFYGLGVPQNFEEAVKLLTKGAEKGNSNAQNLLGWMYEHGEGVTEDVHKAFELYQKSAEKGHYNAQLNLGLLYYNGKGTKVNKTMAFNLWSKAAEQDSEVAQFYLGYLYNCGEGVAQDYSKSMEWYIRAAEKGYGYAQHSLAEMFKNGQGSSVDYYRALHWFRKAADNGIIESQYNLGEMFENGLGTPIDIDEAKKWYNKAAEQGNSDAKVALQRLQ